MAEHAGGSGGGKPASGAGGSMAGEMPADIISLEDAEITTPVAPGATGGKGDTLMAAAEAFEQQIKHMSAWKHQLAAQMELLRRDGLKLLERQKNLALERKKLQQERDDLLAERTQIQKSQEQLAGDRQKLEEKATALEKTSEQLLALQAQREKWLGDLAQAREAAEALAGKRAQLETEVNMLAGRAAEYRQLETQRDALLGQIRDAKATLTELGTAQQELLAQSKHIEARALEVRKQADDLAGRQAQVTAQEAALQRAAAEVEAQRQALAQTNAQLTRQQEQLDAQMAEHTAWLAEARRQIEADQFASKQQLAAAEQRLGELSDAQHKFEVDRQELAGRAVTLEALEAKLGSQQQEIQSAREQLQAHEQALRQAQEQLAAHQQVLAGTEQQLATRQASLDTEIAARTEKLQAAEAQLQTAEAAFAASRTQAQKRLDEREAAVADEMELLARHTRRLSERRAEIEQQATDLEAAMAQRIAAATKQMRAELAGERAGVAEELAGNAARLQALEAQLVQIEQQRTAAVEEKAQLAAQADALRSELTAAHEAAEGLKRQLATAGSTSRRIEELEAQLAEFASKHAGLEKSARERFAAGEALSQQLAAERGAKEALEQQVISLRAELADALARAAAEVTAPAAPAGDTAALQEQIKQLEMQRDELGSDLLSAQEALGQVRQELALARSTVDADVAGLKVRCQALEEENKKLIAAARRPQAALSPAAGPRTPEQRGRVLRQAKALRNLRAHMKQAAGMVDKNRQDLATEREALRLRKENLAQVQRLLEKQELVMARKLADHNAAKTVAAVVIAVFMILGGTFYGVYKLANPVYSSEAMVQVAVPEKLSPAELATWLQKQPEVIRSSAITHEAWKRLRSDEFRYNGHEGRDAWLASLPAQLKLQVNPATRTISVLYDAPSAEGAAQVCNALALTYAHLNKAAAPAPLEVIKAFPKTTPTKDNRFLLSLGVTACLLFVALLAVIATRHYIARQLREIDRMADEADLEEIKDDLPVDAKVV